MPDLAETLNLMCPFSRYGPSAGDPVTAAANAAARILGGQIDYVRPVPAYPPGMLH